jgi:WD40 repeat protein/class 3 adenylate cyclase
MSRIEPAQPGEGSAAAPVERAFLIADVRGYTRFTREHGDAESARLVIRFADLARDAVAARGGQVIELRGDEALAVFTSPVQAVRAAIELLAACAEEEAADPTLPLHVGVGIDAGEAIPVESGFRGSPLNAAARLCSVAAAGQIMITAAVAERSGMVEDARFESRGLVELKGFEPGLEVVEVVPVNPGTVPVSLEPKSAPLELEPKAPVAGRATELSWLRGTWRQARRGNGRIVFVSAAPQMGKSALAAELSSLVAADGATVTYAGAGGVAAARAVSALDDAARDGRPALVVLDDLDLTAEAVGPALEKHWERIEEQPTLVLGLVRDADATPMLARLISRADARGDGHRRLGPLDSESIREIAALYAGEDVADVPLESIARGSAGVAGRVHELMSSWAEQEATRRLAAAGEWLATERRERQADLEFANNVIGLKLARLYGEGGAPPVDAVTQCPYKGLASFGADDARLFFGRERLVGELAARTVGSGLLAVVGASGSGKSSLIAAGLLPSLREGLLPGSKRWQSVAMRPGPHPLEAFAALELESADPTERLVLVVDQFEELFTMCTDEDERSRFADRIVALADDPERAVVVVGLRGDYYDRCAAYPALAALLAANQVLVGPMALDELRRAVELPARRAGVRVESALVERIVSELGHEAGGLPLLSTALVELWFAQTDGWLRLETHESLGGVRGAVARLAESSYDHLSPEAQEAARRLFLRLVQTGEEGTLARRRVPLAELDLGRDPELANVVATLTEDRLLTAHDGAVEVAHEAVLREWPRLQSWLSEDVQGRELREHLTESARRWDEQNRDAADLYRGARLSATRDWASTHQRELNALEREFLAESGAESEHELTRQRRTNRRLKGLLAGVGVLLALAIGAGAIALVSRSDARHEATVALGRQLGAEAVSEPRIDRAMLLARESLRLDRSPQTEGTLLATLLRSPALTATFTVPASQRPQEVRVSPDGRRLAVVTNNNVMYLFDAQTHKELRTLPLANFDYDFVPGTHDLFAAGNGSLPFLLVDPGTGRVLRKFELSQLWENTLTTPVEPLVITPDGRRAILLWAVENRDSTVGTSYAEVWSVRHGGQSRLVPLHSKDVLAATATPDGRLVVVGDGEITRWNSTTMKRISAVPGPRLSSLDVHGAISPDGRTFAYGLSDGTVHFVNVASGRTISGQGAHTAQVDSLAFSPDSRLVASTGNDRTVIVWNARTGEPLERLDGHGGSVVSAAFSRDGKTLYSVSLDGTVLEWDLGGRLRFGDPVAFGQTETGNSTSPADPAPRTPILAMSGDGGTFAVHSAPTSLALYSTGSLKHLRTVVVPGGGSVWAAAWAGPNLVLGTDSGAVEEWSTSGTPALTRRLTGLPTGRYRPIRGLATGDSGHLVAAIDGYVGPRPKAGGPLPDFGELVVWRDGEIVGNPLRLHTFADSVAFSPDASTLALTTDDGRVLIVDPRTARVERTIPVDASANAVVSFSPDGTLAVGSWSGIVQLRNATTGAQIGHDLVAAQWPVDTIAFDPTGRTFATSVGPGGAAARVWSTSTLQQFGSDLEGTGTDQNMAFTPDGRYLLVVTDDGTVTRWPVSVAAWEQHACAVAGRNLTREEWARYVGNRPYSNVCG